MEQANDFAAIRIKPSDVRTLEFETVAMDASEGEILKPGRAPVLPRNDVVYLVYLERRRVKCRGQLAILTARNALAAKPDG